MTEKEFVQETRGDRLTISIPLMTIEVARAMMKSGLVPVCPVCGRTNLAAEKE